MVMDDGGAANGGLYGKVEVSDSGAICQLLAERFQWKRPLAGQAHERPQVLQWIGFAETLIQIASGSSVIKGEVSLEEQGAAASEKLAKNVAVLEKHLSEGYAGASGAGGPNGSYQYLLQSGFSFVDCLMGWSLNSYESRGYLKLGEATGTPLTAAYLNRLRERPAYQKAYQYAERGPGVHARL